MRGDLAEARQLLRELRGDGPTGEGRVTLRLSDPVAELVIDHPRARHALTVRMMLELVEAVDALAAWAGVAVLVRSSTPEAFCAGGHLGEVRRGLVAPEAGRRMARAMGLALDALGALPMVSVAALEGPAVGGGVELALATDLRFAAPEAFLELRQVPLGVAAGWGGAARLTRLLGPSTALRLMVDGRAIEASVARALGLVDEVTEAPTAAARAWLERVAGWPPEAVRAAKRQVLAASDPEAQVAAFASVWGGPAHRRALGLDD